LARAGFIVTPDDPRRAVAACPGAPACRSGTTPVPDHAARLAQALAPLAGLTAHVSGCAKGCAHPGPADLTLVGRDGAYDVVLAGPPSAEPATRLAFEVALDRIRKAAAAGLPALDPVFQDDVPG
jgi:precorrin-3B synthase